MRAAVTARVDDLPPRAQLTIKVASVLGTHIPLPLLAAVHPDNLPGEALADDMAELCAADFVESVPPEGSWRWCQELTRAAVYALLPVATRQALHRAVAVALGVGGREQLEELGLEAQLAVAHHWMQACAGNEAAAVDDVQQVLGGACVALSTTPTD